MIAFGLGVVDADGELGRGEAAEDDRVDRAEPGAGQHGDERLRHHRHVDDDPVALADAAGRERAGEPGHPLEQLGIGEGRLGAGDGQVVDDRRPVAVAAATWRSTALWQMLQPRVGEPAVERRAGGVERDASGGALPVDRLGGPHQNPPGRPSSRRRLPHSSHVAPPGLSRSRTTGRHDRASGLPWHPDAIYSPPLGWVRTAGSGDAARRDQAPAVDVSWGYRHDRVRSRGDARAAGGQGRRPAGGGAHPRRLVEASRGGRSASDRRSASTTSRHRRGCPRPDLRDRLADQDDDRGRVLQLADEGVIDLDAPRRRLPAGRDRRRDSQRRHRHRAAAARHALGRPELHSRRKTPRHAALPQGARGATRTRSFGPAGAGHRARHGRHQCAGRASTTATPPTCCSGC